MNGKKTENDLEAIEQNLQDYKIDDKTSRLEAQYQQLGVESKRIYFILIFVATFFFLLFVSDVAKNVTIVLASLGSLIFLLGLSEWLGFHFIGDHLKRWHILCLKIFHKRNNIPYEEYEPKPDNKAIN